MGFWSGIPSRFLSKKGEGSITTKINSKYITSPEKLNQALQKELGEGRFEIQVINISFLHSLRLTGTHQCLDAT